MNFAEIDFSSFCEVLKSMKHEIEAELKKDPNLDDESQVLLESINFLIKELKDVASYDNMNLEKKKKVLPHLSLVFVFTRSLYEDEEGAFDQDEDAEWDAECEEGECDEEELHGKGKLPMSSHQCCGGGHHHHGHDDDHKTPKGKK